jgi:hypothetical protein
MNPSSTTFYQAGVGTTLEIVLKNMCTPHRALASHCQLLASGIRPAYHADVVVDATATAHQKDFPSGTRQEGRHEASAPTSKACEAKTKSTPLAGHRRNMHTNNLLIVEIRLRRG